MSKKAEPKHYPHVDWPVFDGEPIYKWIRIGRERYPLTYEQWLNRQERLLKAHSEGAGE